MGSLLTETERGRINEFLSFSTSHPRSLTPDLVRAAEDRLLDLFGSTSAMTREFSFTFPVDGRDYTVAAANVFFVAVYSENCNIVQALVNLGFPYKTAGYGSHSSRHSLFLSYPRVASRSLELLDLLLSLWEKRELETLSGVNTFGERYRGVHAITFFLDDQRTPPAIIRRLLDHFTLGRDDISRILQGSTASKERKRAVLSLIAEDEFMRSGFEGMVGLGEVKEKVSDILASYRMANSRGKSLDPPKLVFVGSPGTGKTEVARELAKFFSEVGVIRSEKAKVLKGPTLKAQWLGHTAVNLEKLFDEIETAGQLLFIDEFYALFPDDPRAAASEYVTDAAGVLLTRVEELKPGAAIIIAGYPDKMEAALSSISGLDGRFSDYVYFEDYSVSECMEILSLMLGAYDLGLPTGLARSELERFVERLTLSESFANARSMRQLAKHIFQKVSRRTTGGEDYAVKQADWAGYSDAGGFFAGIREKQRAKKGERAAQKIHRATIKGQNLISIVDRDAEKEE